MTYPRRAGLTLMELLIVLAILVALLAILLPAVFTVQARWLVRQASMQIGTLQGQLEQYSLDNRGYPTNEQGLYALAFIPDNVGVLPTVPQPGAGGMTDPALSGGMMGGSNMAGPEALANPSVPPTGMTPGAPGALPSATPGMTDPTMAAAGGTTPPAMGNSMMTDPTGMGMGGMGTTGTMTSTWNQYVHNPQLYLQQRRRSEATSYIPNLEGLIDPWGTPYRYDNSMQYYGLNQTGSSKPAIWSAGPDKQDGTDDDIRSWVPADAAQALALRAQQMQGGVTGMGQTGTVDPMSGMQTMPMQPGMGTGMPAMPPTTQPGMGTGMPAMPTTQPGMGTGMPAMPTTPPGMGTGTPAMPTTPPGMGTGMPAMPPTPGGAPQPPMPPM